MPSGTGGDNLTAQDAADARRHQEALASLHAALQQSDLREIAGATITINVDVSGIVQRIQINRTAYVRRRKEP
jgi:hypothetical protein